MQVAFFLPSNITPSTPATAGVPGAAADPTASSFETILASNDGGTPVAGAEPSKPPAPATDASVAQDWQDEPVASAALETDGAVTNALLVATQAAATAATPAPVPEPEETLPTDTPVAAEAPSTGDESENSAPTDASVVPAEGDACVPAHRAGHGRALGHTKGKHHDGHLGAPAHGRCAGPATGVAAVSEVPSTDPAIPSLGPAADPAISEVEIPEAARTAESLQSVATPAAAATGAPNASIAASLDRPAENTVSDAAPRTPRVDQPRGRPRGGPQWATAARATQAATPTPLATVTAESAAAATETADKLVGAVSDGPAPEDCDDGVGALASPPAAEDLRVKPGPRRDEPVADRAAGRAVPAARAIDVPAAWRVRVSMPRLGESTGERGAVPVPSNCGAAPAVPANSMSTAPTLAQVLVEQRAALVPSSAQQENPVGANAVRATAGSATLHPNDGLVAGLSQPPVGAALSASTSDEPAVLDEESEMPEAVDRSSGGGATERPLQKAPVRENFAGAAGTRPRATKAAEPKDQSRNFLDVEKHEVGERRSAVGTGIAKESQPMALPSQVLPDETVTSLEATGAAIVGGRESAPMVTTLRPGAEAVVRHSAAMAVRETVDAAAQMRETSRHSVDLVLETPSAEKLHVHLRWQDGVVQAKFVTQSTELQQALAREWEHAAPRLAERSVKFGEPSFERHDQSGQPGGQGAFSFEQQRQSSRGRERSAEFGDELGIALSSARGANRGAAGAARTASTTQSTPTPRAADKRNLSAWA